MKKGPAQPADPFCDVSDLLVQTELLVELGHASAGIHQLLLAREEGVTLRADFHLDITLGRTCLNHITAGASNRSLLIIGMDSFLHCSRSPLSLQNYLCKAFTLQGRSLEYHSLFENASLFSNFFSKAPGSPVSAADPQNSGAADFANTDGQTAASTTSLAESVR